MAIDDEPLLEVVAPMQETVTPVIELAHQAPASVTQALEIGVSELVAAVHPDHDTLPVTLDAPAGLVLVSRVADIPSSLPVLMLPSSVPPCSLTIRLVSSGNEVHQFFFLAILL